MKLVIRNNQFNHLIKSLFNHQLITNQSGRRRTGPLFISNQFHFKSNPIQSTTTPFNNHHLTRNTYTMAPIGISDAEAQVLDLIKNNKVMIFSKTTCSYCKMVKELFTKMGVPFNYLELDTNAKGEQLHEALKTVVKGVQTVPQVFVNGKHIGGGMDTLALNEKGALNHLKNNHGYDYDLIIIGGGSGGLAASKESAKYGVKVAMLDFVKPSPLGTTWGLGGTCVNVGCIPKKMMHVAALIGETFKDTTEFGWSTSDDKPLVPHGTTKHSWINMKDEVQEVIKSSNFKYRVLLRDENVKYINAYGSFVDQHKVKLVDKKGNESFLTADKFIVATGERPRYPTDCTGVKEYAITSDDLFSLEYPPGKTLVVGASYVALECAGFLAGFGFDVTVMVRSIFLRGFDQDMAERAASYMKTHEKVKFIRPAVPYKIEQIEAGKPGKLRVLSKNLDSGENITGEYNTVLFAIGRDACTENIGLEVVGVKKNPKTGKIPVVNEQTNVPHIYAVGDILEGKLELTPVAIKAGVLLARRLYTNSTTQCDYLNVPTTVFTPLEYGSCGYSEDAAIAKFGLENLEIYVQHFKPFEWPRSRPLNICYAKIICLKNQKEKVVGIHFLGPNAGEVMQFGGIALKLNATKQDFDDLVGIHPTSAEVFTNMSVTKRSGKSAEMQGCCG